ncbi:MAG: T9SS type A sorting domain-containing protein [bacterium]
MNNISIRLIILYFFLVISVPLFAQTLGLTRDETAPMITSRSTVYPPNINGYCKIVALVHLHVTVYSTPNSVLFNAYHPSDYDVTYEIQPDGKLEFDLEPSQTVYIYFPSTSESGTTLNVEADGPLPIALSSFYANTLEHGVILYWTTAAEIDLNKFELEKVTDSENIIANNWAGVTTIQASGNSNSPKEYSYKQNFLNTGKYKFRLKMIDNNGSLCYSDELKIEIGNPNSTELKQNYPNSFNPTTKIEYQLANNSYVRLELYSITGELVSVLVDNNADAGYYQFYFDANKINGGLASGVYIYRLIARDRSNSENVILNKKMMYLK